MSPLPPLPISARLALWYAHAGVASPAQFLAREPVAVYKLLCLLFSASCVAAHCRRMEEAAERRELKPATLHSHFAHLAMLRALAARMPPPCHLNGAYSALCQGWKTLHGVPKIAVFGTWGRADDLGQWCGFWLVVLFFRNAGN